MRTVSSKNRIAFLIVLCLCLMTGLCACGEQADGKTSTAPVASGGEEQSEIQGPDDENNKVLVVYFSHTGTTRGVSEYLHEVVGGDLIEIEPVNPYPEGYSDALDPAKKEQQENARPEIANVIEHFDSYEVIYLG